MNDTTTPTELLDTARKGVHLLRSRLPKDGMKIKASTEFLQAADSVIEALAENDDNALEYWSAKAKIRANDMTGDTMRIITHGRRENPQPVEFIDALSKHQVPNLAPLEQWLDSLNQGLAA